MKYKISIIFFVFFSISLRAHEGMWIPLLIQQQVFPAMQKAGCKLTPEQIYNANQASLTDAIVKIGEGCSGGFISNQGLVVTNFHCVEYFINQKSTLENNYLKQGFWAKSLSEELPATGLSVELLIQITDVTERILSCVKNVPESELHLRKSIVIDSIQKLEQTNSKYIVSIESFYANNQYFMFTAIKYTDVRLVGFPSIQMARFGGNIDEWKWPRHSADFTLLRVYCDSAQMPKKYDVQNIPFIPKKSLIINPNGVKEGDFTMVMGYPAKTNNFATAEQIRVIHDSLNPRQIAMRGIRIKPIKTYMKTSDTAYFQYYSKYSNLVNYYIKWQGEQYGIEHTNAIKRKIAQEKQFQTWISKTDSINYLQVYNSAYNEYNSAYTVLILYLQELWEMDYFKHVSAYFPLYMLSDFDTFEKTVKEKKNYSNHYYSTVERKIEMESIPQMLEYMCRELPQNNIPEFLRGKSLDQRKVIYNEMLQNSLLNNPKKTKEFYKKIDKVTFDKHPEKIRKYLNKDKGFYYSKEMYNFIVSNLYPNFLIQQNHFEMVEEEYMKKLLEYYKDSIIAPDANLTMRVAFGNIKRYNPNDAVICNYITTSDGIQQKLQMGNQEYVKDEKLMAILESKQFGTYSNDTLFLNFVATNQTSGGNSGSPIMDAYGNIIGLNFDRNWEGTMGDFSFDESVCRNISVDIRYILFCIEMYGKATNILNELMFVK